MVMISFHESDRANYPIWDDRNRDNPHRLAARQCYVATP
jgi:hypothetical protein